MAWHESSRRIRWEHKHAWRQKRQQSYGSLSDIKNCSQELERWAETNSQSTIDLQFRGGGGGGGDTTQAPVLFHPRPRSKSWPSKFSCLTPRPHRKSGLDPWLYYRALTTPIDRLERLCPRFLAWPRTAWPLDRLTAWPLDQLQNFALTAWPHFDPGIMKMGTRCRSDMGPPIPHIASDLGPLGAYVTSGSGPPPQWCGPPTPALKFWGPEWNL